jgi:tetratricopeptide (TPR) repeat protein
MSAVARRYFVRAQKQQAAGDLDGAREGFAAALELCPAFVEARIGSALLLASRDPMRAAQLLRAGRARSMAKSARYKLACALAEVLLLGGDFAGAEAAYVEALTLIRSTELDGRIARLRAKAGRYAEAIAAFSVAAAKRC